MSLLDDVQCCLFTAEEERAMQDNADLMPGLDPPVPPMAEKCRHTPIKKERKPRTVGIKKAPGGIVKKKEEPVPATGNDDGTKPRKNKRKRVPEFDPQSGEWVDVRRFDRMPVTIEEAEEGENASKVPHGAYFVSLAHKRISGIVQLHSRWLTKTKNQCSDYADVQRDLMDFFSGVLEQFNRRYSVYTTHPQFESIGKTRKRQQKTTA